MRERPLTTVFLVLAALVSSALLTRNTDFRVYWIGINEFVAGQRPLYGPGSGIGFPMQFRYPPVSVLLLWPFLQLPLRLAGICWGVLATLAVAAVTRLAIRTGRLQFRAAPAIAGCALMLPYCVLALRYGNVQPLLIALIFAALLLAARRPWLAGAFLAIAMSFKIWPAFFLPWFFAKARRQSLIPTTVAFAVLWLLPVIPFGPRGYATLLREWYRYEWHTVSQPAESWYPSQSLRGMLLRFLSPQDPTFTKEGFPDVHVFSLPPGFALLLWLAMAAVVYAFVIFFLGRAERPALWDALAFVLFSILQPFCHKSSLISLWPAVLVVSSYASSYASRYATKSTSQAARLWYFAACILSFGSALIQYKPAQRLLLMLGLDFWVMLALLTALALWLRAPESDDRDAATELLQSPPVLPRG